MDKFALLTLDGYFAVRDGSNLSDKPAGTSYGTEIILGRLAYTHVRIWCGLYDGIYYKTNFISDWKRISMS